MLCSVGYDSNILLETHPPLVLGVLPPFLLPSVVILNFIKRKLVLNPTCFTSLYSTFVFLEFCLLILDLELGFLSNCSSIQRLTCTGEVMEAVKLSNVRKCLLLQGNEAKKKQRHWNGEKW